MSKLLTFLLSIWTIIAFGQTPQNIELNWKIGQNEKLIYKTIMTDMEGSDFLFNFQEIYKNENIKAEMNSFFEGLRAINQKIEFRTHLINAENDVVNILMESRQKKGTTIAPEADELLEQLLKRQIVLRGAIHKKGAIHSFWTKTRQKNLIALFFELPSTPVKVGDTWQLDINLIANDQNFECKNAYKINAVTLVDRKEINGDTIAIIDYHIEEYAEGLFHMPASSNNPESVETSIKFSFKASALFSITQGKWIAYDGIMEVNSTGLMATNKKTKYALIPE